MGMGGDDCQIPSRSPARMFAPLAHRTEEVAQRYLVFRS